MAHPRQGRHLRGDADRNRSGRQLLDRQWHDRREPPLGPTRRGPRLGRVSDCADIPCRAAGAMTGLTHAWRKLSRERRLAALAALGAVRLDVPALVSAERAFVNQQDGPPRRAEPGRLPGLLLRRGGRPAGRRWRRSTCCSRARRAASSTCRAATGRWCWPPAAGRRCCSSSGCSTSPASAPTASPATSASQWGIFFALVAAGTARLRRLADARRPPRTSPARRSRRRGGRSDRSPPDPPARRDRAARAGAAVGARARAALPEPGSDAPCAAPAAATPAPRRREPGPASRPRPCPSSCPSRTRRSAELADAGGPTPSLPGCGHSRPAPIIGAEHDRRLALRAGLGRRAGRRPA